MSLYTNEQMLEATGLTSLVTAKHLKALGLLAPVYVKAKESFSRYEKRWTQKDVDRLTYVKTLSDHTGFPMHECVEIINLLPHESIDAGDTIIILDRNLIWLEHDRNEDGEETEMWSQYEIGLKKDGEWQRSSDYLSHPDPDVGGYKSWLSFTIGR